ncbi:hypothetical protein GLW08_06805 [Pontibacillus yanchengensis]|uniref:Uncharacterized protein n=2 Tax=Pontibacillus yanchengensis TaxID=462910 RepID=A0ACC7VDR6_9BACI|nr:hypothetical protein [Pontibacillus yanchengensis]MYL32465.1 hypothetical protein [Pontibacillus yanchengensis]MYL53046.1 hypothetical protein [Pontibacillus yanchengensis]
MYHYLHTYTSSPFVQDNKTIYHPHQQVLWTGVDSMLYLIITSIIFTFVTIIVPKRLSKIEIYASTFSAL